MLLLIVGDDCNIRMIQARDQARSDLEEVRKEIGSLNLHEDDIFHFDGPDPNALAQITCEMGYVGGSGFGPNCAVDGEGLKKGLVGKEARFILVVKDHLGDRCRKGGDHPRIVITDPDGRMARSVTVNDGHNGAYKVHWVPIVDGEHKITITIKDLPVANSPYTVQVI